MPRVGIALGSNLGDRLGKMSLARDLLRELGRLETVGSVRAADFLQSSLYQTVPVDCPEGSGDFLNAVVELSWHDSALDLLKKTQAIEIQLGRNRTFSSKNAPRPIDIDILYFGGKSIFLDQLQIPHPRLIERQFVLKPLSEIVPDFVLPGHTKTVARLCENLQESPLAKFREAADW